MALINTSRNHHLISALSAVLKVAQQPVPALLAPHMPTYAQYPNSNPVFKSEYETTDQRLKETLRDIIIGLGDDAFKDNRRIIHQFAQMHAEVAQSAHDILLPLLHAQPMHPVLDTIKKIQLALCTHALTTLNNTFPEIEQLSTNSNAFTAEQYNSLKTFMQGHGLTPAHLLNFYATNYTQNPEAQVVALGAPAPYDCHTAAFSPAPEQNEHVLSVNPFRSLAHQRQQLAQFFGHAALDPTQDLAQGQTAIAMYNHPNAPRNDITHSDLVHGLPDGWILRISKQGADYMVASVVRLTDKIEQAQAVYRDIYGNPILMGRLPEEA